MNYTALSLSQTPPLSVPLPYFLVAPLFLAAAALLLLGAGPELLATRWSPSMLALTHLLSIGFLGTVMLGAMQQLVPVLVGVPLAAPRAVAYGLLPLWLSGAVLLVSGMAAAVPPAVQSGAILLGLVVVLFALLVVRSLWLSSSQHATVRALFLAVVSFVLTVTPVLYLVLRFGGHLPLAHPLTALHIGWGSLGWLFLLLAGVAYQVVPMFQITPDYPRPLRRWLGPAIAALLLLWSAHILLPPLRHVVWLLPAGLVLFAVQTLVLQARRRRRLADVTLDFWRLAMLSLLLAVGSWGALPFLPAARLELAVGLLFFVGFAVSAVNGMLYKIVPFLIWLHLNNRLQRSGRWQGRVPNMKQVIPERYARRQFRLHLLALLLLLAALIVPALAPPAALALLLSALGLWWNLLLALRLYRRLLREQTGGDVA